jgi:hypothetical protein
MEWWIWVYQILNHNRGREPRLWSWLARPSGQNRRGVVRAEARILRQGCQMSQISYRILSRFIWQRCRQALQDWVLPSSGKNKLDRSHFRSFFSVLSSKPLPPSVIATPSVAPTILGQQLNPSPPKRPASEAQSIGGSNPSPSSSAARCRSYKTFYGRNF